MRRSIRSARRPVVLAAAIASAAACGGPPSVTAQTYAPGERSAGAGPLRMDLTEAIYDERLLTLRVTFANTSDRPAQVQRRGILLAYDGLEFPLAAEAGGPEGAFELAASEAREVSLVFAVGTRLVGDGSLVLRSIRVGDTWQPLVAVPVAAAPLVAEPED